MLEKNKMEYFHLNPRYARPLWSFHFSNLQTENLNNPHHPVYGSKTHPIEFNYCANMDSQTRAKFQQVDNLMKAINKLELSAKDLVQAANKVDMDPMELALNVVKSSVTEALKVGVKTPLIPPTPPQPNNNSSDSDESEYPSGSDESENDSRDNRFYRKLCGY